MTFQIRDMTETDIDAARRLWAGADGVEVGEGDSPEDLVRYLRRNPGSSTVATDADGRLVGAVLCGHDGRRGFVYHLAVARELRGQGVGRAIMQRSLSRLKEHGILRVLLLVSADNPGGRSFWLREGWENMPYAKPMGIDL